MKYTKITYSVLLLLLIFVTGCREDEVIFRTKLIKVATPVSDAKVVGFYHLNEGNMGMNRASIDYFDITKGIFAQDIYSEANPNVVKELGDVGNDIQVYGDKVYAVINCSNKVEVMDKHTAKRLKVIPVPNCRYVVFDKDKAYVSSYAGPVGVDPNAIAGFVVEIDTLTLETKRQVAVGYQPEEMVITDNKLYVANSGGYRVPKYDTTVSVIDLDSFKEIKKIDVAINLHRMAIDKKGRIYVSSRGDYYTIPSNTYMIDSKTDKVIRPLGFGASEFCMSGDSLYYYSTEWSYITGSNKITFGIYDTEQERIVTDQIIKDGTDKYIMIPYGLAVNPENKDIYISDAQNYIVSGYIYCYSKEGSLKWRVLGGNIPGHFAFVYGDGKPMNNYKDENELTLK